MFQDRILQTNILPDAVIRIAVRTLLRGTLKQQKEIAEKYSDNYINHFLDSLVDEKLAIETDKANEQHYEVPSLFYQKVLGKHLKYSSGLWANEKDTLDSSEKNMLDLYVHRAQIEDGQEILDMGCGWGSLSLYLAERFPKSNVTGISNSATQREFIEKECEKRGLNNLTIRTVDVNDFTSDTLFDRIVSVEMFEHVRNYTSLFKKLKQLLKDDGMMFIHVFAHFKYAYLFDSSSKKSWMSRTFFSGGTMPSENLLPSAAKDFTMDQHWIVSGVHYQKTLEAWLKKMDQQKESIIPIFKETYGDDYKKMWIYWRVFFMSCAETFGFDKGNQWRVSHYLFKKK